jgi:Kef-type K+ transport system membrane component KefB
MLLRVLLQLIVIIAAARMAGVAFRKLGQPRVCGIAVARVRDIIAEGRL